MPSLPCPGPGMEKGISLYNLFGSKRRRCHEDYTKTAAEGPGRRPIPALLRLLACRKIREGGWPVWKATRCCHVKRQSVYRWLSRYDGTPESLASRSRRPKRSPRSIPREAARRIASLWRKHKGIGWSSCGAYARMLGLGHSVSYSTVLRYLKKADGYAPYRTNPKARAPRKYHTPEYPGEKWQMDVKFVPSERKAPTLPADKGHYQYTVIDEASRKRFLYFCDERSVGNSTAALAGAVAFFGYPPKVVQTDNGTEFCGAAPRDSGEPSAFGLCLARLGADHKRIRPGAPRHNGNVERSHRIDQEKFYSPFTRQPPRAGEKADEEVKFGPEGGAWLPVPGPSRAWWAVKAAA